MSLLPLSPSTCHEVVGPETLILVFLILSFKPAFSLSSFTFIKRLFSFSLLSAIICISEVVDISPSNFDSSFNSFSLTFYIMYSAKKLNKQGDNIQDSIHTPFPIVNQLVVSYPVLTVAY